MTFRSKWAALLWMGLCLAEFAVAATPSVGLLWIAPNDQHQTFLDALRSKGFVPNETVRIVDGTVRGGYDGLPQQAATLVQAKVDVIFAYGGTATIEAARATKSIPIVMIGGIDPVSLGFASSLAHPGGNLTGLSTNILQMTGKRIEFLKELYPRLSKVGLLAAADSSVSSRYVDEALDTARQLKLQTSLARIHSESDLEQAIAGFKRTKVDGIVIIPSTLLYTLKDPIVALAGKYRLPAVYPISTYTQIGGLISYSPDYADQHRRAATYVERILKGARPSDMPIEQPVKIETIVNLKTARELGIRIPNSILVRADKVIE